MSPVIPMAPGTNIAVNADHLVAELGDDLVIMSVQTGSYYGLDAVGVSVWKRLEQPCNFADLVAHVLDRFDVDAASAEKDLTVLLNEMRAEGLVSITAEGGAG